MTENNVSGQTMNTCPHIGVEHPMNFQCLDCEDTADDCNCFHSAGVFCEKCQKIVWVSCDEVVSEWYKQNRDKDMQLEKYKIQGIITGYHSSSTTKMEEY